MTEHTEIVKREDGWLAPALSLEEAERQYKAMKAFVERNLREGVDYGKIPGTQKPTCLKPGAEKLTKFFGLTVELDPSPNKEVIDWDRPLFYFRYGCNVLKDGRVIARAFGSCNSMEKKYYYRYIPDFKATEEQKNHAVKQEVRTSKQGNKYTMLTIVNDDPFSQVNTFEKMAQKRAFVAAVLIAVNGSEYFTQDLEDMGDSAIVEDGFEESEKNGNGNDTKRSYAGDFIEKVEKWWVEADVLPEGDDRRHLINLLNKSPFSDNALKKDLVKWGKAYRSFRDQDATAADAAELATKEWQKP